MAAVTRLRPLARYRYCSKLLSLILPRRLMNTALASAFRASPLFSPACTRRRSSTLCSQSKINSARSMRPSSRNATARPFWREFAQRRPLIGLSDASLVTHLKRGAIFRSHLAVIMDPGGGNIGMSQSLLHLGNIRPVIQDIGRGRGPHHVRPHVLARKCLMECKPARVNASSLADNMSRSIILFAINSS